MVNFAALKNRSTNSLQKLQEEASKMNQKGGNKDARLWELELDKAGNGSATIRFLPAPGVDGEDGVPWVRIFRHSFQGPGGWYIENSLTTIGQDDPCGERNSELWNTKIEANQKYVRDHSKRKTVYYANILVVEDPKNPGNNGKVFLYRFGKKIFEKITNSMNPKFQGDTPVNPFDAWTGADFKLRVYEKDGFSNYDESKFAEPAPFGDDKYIETIWGQEYSLKEFLDPKNFKSYDELKKRLDKVVNGSTAPKTVGDAASRVAEAAARPAQPSTPAPAANLPPRQEIPKSTAQKQADVGPDESDDNSDAMALFARLAKD
jgi:hypothetical protein